MSVGRKYGIQFIRVFTGTIMKVLYGFDLKEPYDPYVAIGGNAMEGFSTAGFPGKFLVDIIPACKSNFCIIRHIAKCPTPLDSEVKYVPGWFPGAGFQKTARHFKSFLPPLINKPLQELKGLLVSRFMRENVDNFLKKIMPPSLQEKRSRALYWTR